MFRAPPSQKSKERMPNLNFESIFDCLINGENNSNTGDN